MYELDGKIRFVVFFISSQGHEGTFTVINFNTSSGIDAGIGSERVENPFLTNGGVK